MLNFGNTIEVVRRYVSRNIIEIKINFHTLLYKIVSCIVFYTNNLLAIISENYFGGPNLCLEAMP